MPEPTTQWVDAPAPAAQPVAQPVEPLETRVARLETAVAALQDTRALEERVAQRVGQQMQAAVASEAQRLVAAERRTSPAGMLAAAETVMRAVATPAAPLLTRPPMLVVDLYLEAVAIFRMFFDLRYRVAWTTRVLVLLLLPAILTSHWWVPFAPVPVIGGLLDKLVDLLLAFVMFKALSREARRYLELRHPQ